MAETTAATIYDILQGDSDTANHITVNATGTAWSKAFPMPKDVSFGWEFQFSTGGAVDVKIELEQSNQERIDTQLTNANYVIPDGGGQISAGITDENVHIIAFAPKVSGFARLKLTGQGSNAADTKLARARMVYIRD